MRRRKVLIYFSFFMAILFLLETKTGIVSAWLKHHKVPLPNAIQSNSVNFKTGSSVIQQSEPCQCIPTRETMPSARHPADGRWYNFSAPGFQLYAYSAFYYNPQAHDISSLLSSSKILDPPTIKITAVSTNLNYLSKNIIFENLSNLWKRKILCIVNYDRFSTTTTIRKFDSIGSGVRLFDKLALEYVFICELNLEKLGHLLGGSSQSLPVSVSIIIVDDDGDDAMHVLDDLTTEQLLMSSCIPVELAETPKSPAAKHDFCSCVARLHGQLNPLRIIEWIEMQKILGITMIMIYDYDTSVKSPDVWRIVLQYARDGSVEIRATRRFQEYEDHEFDIHNAPILTDCLYRNMFRCNYVVVVDLDEIIAPNHPQVKTLRELINEIGALNKISFNNSCRLNSTNLYNTAIKSLRPEMSTHIALDKTFFGSIAKYIFNFFASKTVINSSTNEVADLMASKTTISSSQQNNQYIKLTQEINFGQDPPKPCSFAFRNNYFFLDQKPQNITLPSIPISNFNLTGQGAETFIFLRYHTASEITAVAPWDWGKAKSIHDPRACTCIMNHLCMGRTQLAEKENRSVFQEIRPAIALNRHYKRCDLSFSPEQCLDDMTHQDNTMLKYTDSLVANLKRVYEKINKVS